MKILMLNTLCLQGLANIERELCASSTACALPSATTALSHQAKALRSTTDERDEYFEGDTDKERLLLHCDVADDTPLGLLNWSVVHGTNMNNTSKLISNNNRRLCHHSLRAGPKWRCTARDGHPFVATLSPANLGDVSPNKSRAQVSGESSPSDGSSTNTDITFGPSIDGDMHKPANIVTLKRPQQVTKCKGTHIHQNVQVTTMV